MRKRQRSFSLRFFVGTLLDNGRFAECDPRNICKQRGGRGAVESSSSQHHHGLLLGFVDREGKTKATVFWGSNSGDSSHGIVDEGTVRNKTAS